METKLTLHEAIAVVLIGRKGRLASFEYIAKEINKRSLYKRKDSLPVPDYQIMQRTTLSSGQYHHFFEKIDNATIRLRNI
jgi:hypothetical protein